MTAGTTSANGTVITGIYGTLRSGRDGNYSYIAVHDAGTTAYAAVQALDDRETLQDSSPTRCPTARRRRTATLTVTVFGTNDAPVCDCRHQLGAGGHVYDRRQCAADVPHPHETGDFADVADTDADASDALTVTYIQGAGDEDPLTVAPGTTSADGTVITGHYGR